jgi:hypothetical protein
VDSCCFIPDENQEAVKTATGRDAVAALACDEPARWVLFTGHSPDDFTVSCPSHVGALLGDAALLHIEPVASTTP